MLKAWNVVLIMVAFFLSIFGTFVVRSGILSSVHAFALSAIGPYFLTFLALAIVAWNVTLFPEGERAQRLRELSTTLPAEVACSRKNRRT